MAKIFCPKMAYWKSDAVVLARAGQCRRCTENQWRECNQEAVKGGTDG